MKTNIPKDWKNTLPRIIAVDFDGTLVPDNWGEETDEVNTGLIALIRYEKKKGAKIILWTCRGEGHGLEEAVKLCKRFGIEFDAVNENIPEVKELFGYDTRKVYANEYWDDKNMKVTPIWR